VLGGAESGRRRRGKDRDKGVSSPRSAARSLIGVPVHRKSNGTAKAGDDRRLRRRGLEPAGQFSIKRVS
jgi:hypothetical protein